MLPLRSCRVLLDSDEDVMTEVLWRGVVRSVERFLLARDLTADQVRIILSGRATPDALTMAIRPPPPPGPRRNPEVTPEPF